LPGETEATATNHIVNQEMVRENYFTTMEIPLLRGRSFTAQDDQRAPQVAVVNQTFAQQLFPNADVLGKHVGISKREVEIVGVVADSKYMSQREDIKPLIYTPWQQELPVIGAMSFALRTTGEPTALAAAVRHVVHEVNSNLPATELGSQTMRSQATLGQERMYARVLTFFGAAALLLAAIGLFGVLAYSVAQRTNEIGIRMALGARTANVLRLIVWQGMRLVSFGLIVGGLAVFALKRLFATQAFAEYAWRRQATGLLYGVTGTDPAVLVVIVGLLSIVALVACWLPARRASKVDPLVALRYE